MQKAFEALKEYWIPPDPKELLRKWQTTLRAEQRALDRQVRDIQFEEKKLQKSIKEAAKRGDMGIAKSMAKEIVHSRKAISRITVNKAQLMSVNNSLIEQLAMVKVAKTLQKSTQVMSQVNSLLKIPEIHKAMMEMSKEMMKAGLIDEMIEDAMGDVLDTEDIEEESEQAIAQVLDEIIGDTLAAMPQAGRARQKEAAAAEEEAEDDEVAQLQARLQAIKS